MFSTLWYRVAAQHPRLRPEVSVQRQHVRDQRWYLLVNAASGRQVRINQKAYEFVGRCDGERTVDEVWDGLVETLRDEAPTQDEVIQTLEALEQQDLLAHDNAPDAKQLVRRHGERVKRRRGFVNPFALRVPVGNPSAALRRLEPLSRLAFGPVAFWIWLVLTAAAAAIGVMHLDVFRAHAADYMATPRYVVLAWVSFPVIKALHELGHALAVRRWGGEVHEVGFTLFVLVPVPYVDASAAAAFRHRYQRVVVGAAGMMAELALAAIALIVWLNVQPGLMRDLAFVTMFIASVSTVMFNGNPLLRFDAYYILCDALGLPNLEPRSKAWWTALISRALSGSGAAQPVQAARGERKWLLLYAPASFAFRIVVACVLVLWIGGYSTVLGVLAALAFLALLVVRPGVAAAKRIWSEARARGNRGRAGAACAAAAAALVVLCAIPLPFHTVARGVVWPPEQALVRPGTNGFVTQVLARDGDWVSKGQVLVVLDDPTLLAERTKLASRLEQMEAGRFAALVDSSERVRRAEEEIVRVQSELQRVEQRIAELELRAQTDGRLVMPRQQDLPGSFTQQGSTLGHVLEQSAIGIRAAVPEYDAVLVRESVRRIDVRIAGETQTSAAELVRDIPAATYELPSAALGDRGGGPHPTDPADKEGLRTREPVVLLDLKVPARALERVGGKVWVRFDHGPQPLAQRWYRQARQMLLQHFSPAG